MGNTLLICLLLLVGKPPKPKRGPETLTNAASTVWKAVRVGRTYKGSYACPRVYIKLRDPEGIPWVSHGTGNCQAQLRLLGLLLLPTNVHSGREFSESVCCPTGFYSHSLAKVNFYLLVNCFSFELFVLINFKMANFKL